MMAVAIAAIAVLVAAAALFIAWQGRTPTPANPDAAALRNEMKLLRESTERSVQGISAGVSAQLQALAGSVQGSLQGVNSDVSANLARVQSTFAGLEKQVGQMTEQARALDRLSRSISDFENILRAPKLRGNFGEVQLESLLSSVFPREQYEMQYRFPTGDLADAVIKFPQGMVAVDSKFPLENFRRIAAAEDDDARKAARREFLKDVRKRIEEIANRYIRPADGTLPFALMYIPAENVYYEAVLRDDDDGIYEACVQKKVLPVSPNSLYTYLQTILVGLNSLRVSERAKLILNEIEALRLEMGRFSDVYAKVGTHLKNARSSYEDSGRELTRVESRVEGMAGGKLVEQSDLFPTEKPRLVSGE